MFLPLTDLLTCPHCGPEVGLILLADRIEDRRVLEGALGCPRCQRRYPVTDGFADLRAGDGPPTTPVEVEAAEETASAVEAEAVAETGAAASASASEPASLEEATRIAALLGIMEGAGYILVIGPGVVQAPALAGLLDGIEVLVSGPGVRGWPEARGLSRIGVGSELPIHSGSIRGVYLSGETMPLLEEAARVLAPGGRLVVEPAASSAAARLEAAGLQVLAREGEVLLAVRA